MVHIWENESYLNTFRICVTQVEYMEHGSIRVPTELIKQIETTIQQVSLGYTSKGELAKEAIREKLAELKTQVDFLRSSILAYAFGVFL